MSPPNKSSRAQQSWLGSEHVVATPLFFPQLTTAGTGLVASTPASFGPPLLLLDDDEEEEELLLPGSPELLVLAGAGVDAGSVGAFSVTSEAVLGPKRSV